MEKKMAMMEQMMESCIMMDQGVMMGGMPMMEKKMAMMMEMMNSMMAQ